MKRIFIIVIGLLLAVPGMAQRQYEIYKVEGSVRVMPKNLGIWVSATVKMSLHEDDVIDISKNGMVCILEPKSGRIYQSNEHGKYSVRKRVEKAAKDAGKMFKQLNRELVRAADKDSKSNNGYVSYAATTRGGSQGNDIYDSLYALILNVTSQNHTSCESLIKVNRIDDEKGMCHYEIINDSKTKYYFNTFVLDGERLKHLYDFNQSTIGLLPILPNSAVDLSAFGFVNGNEKVVFLFSERVFKASGLEQMTGDEIPTRPITEVDGVKCILVK